MNKYITESQAMTTDQLKGEMYDLVGSLVKSIKEFEDKTGFKLAKELTLERGFLFGPPSDEVTHVFFHVR